MANNVDDLVTEINKTNNLLLRQLEDREKVAKNTAGMWAIGKLTLAVEKEIKKVLNDSLKLHEKSLGRGLSLQKVMESTRSQQVQMAGTLTGFATAVQVGYEQFESGLKSNNAATNELALYTKLTGGNSKKLLKQLASLTRGMSLSVEQETSLMRTIQGLSQNFQMTSEEIVDAMEGLGQEMRTFKILGIGPEMTEVAAVLAAALGKQAGDIGSKFISSIVSAEGITAAAALGITEERRAMQRAPSPEIMMRMIEKAMTASAVYRQQILESGAPAIALKGLEKKLGSSLGNIIILGEQLIKQGQGNWRKQLELASRDYKLNQEYTDSWNNFKRLIMSPIQRSLMQLLSGLLNWINENKDFAINLIKTLGKIGAILGLIFAGKVMRRALGMGPESAVATAAMMAGGSRRARLQAAKTGWKFGLAGLWRLIKWPLLALGTLPFIFTNAFEGLTEWFMGTTKSDATEKAVAEERARIKLTHEGSEIGARRGLLPFGQLVRGIEINKDMYEQALRQLDAINNNIETITRIREDMADERPSQPYVPARIQREGGSPIQRYWRD